MSLMEFITENFYFFIIILFAIVSFLSKNKKQSQQEEESTTATTTPTPPPAHSPGGGATERSERIPIEPRSVPEVTNATEKSPSFNEMKKQMKMLELAHEQLETKKQSARTEQVSSEWEESSAYDLKRKVVSGFVSDDIRAEVIKGKMWSEVFGPPRAKNPYRARR